jgi:hypothetical protein
MVCWHECKPSWKEWCSIKFCTLWRKDKIRSIRNITLENSACTTCITILKASGTCEKLQSTVSHTNSSNAVWRHTFIQNMWSSKECCMHQECCWTFNLKLSLYDIRWVYHTRNLSQNTVVSAMAHTARLTLNIVHLAFAGHLISRWNQILSFAISELKPPDRCVPVGIYKEFFRILYQEISNIILYCTAYHITLS